MSTATNNDTRRLLIAVLDVPHTVRELGHRCSSLPGTGRLTSRTNFERCDPRLSQLDRLLSHADRSSSIVYHRTLVRRI